MWSTLPFDLLAKIFSYLSPDSLARAKSACRNWQTCIDELSDTLTPTISSGQPPWFVAISTRNPELCCYLHNPIANKWHILSLDFLFTQIRPIASISSLMLVKASKPKNLHLGICNIFTRQFRHLPVLNIARSNPAVGVVTSKSSQHFRVYVAGGMSSSGYEPTMEMYDSRCDTWQIVGNMPVEFAVRLTVWTPDESVYCNGILYWITSARAYSVMGLEIESWKWLELSVPLADRLEFAALMQRNGVLTLVGGAYDGEACAWELSEKGKWCLIEKAPIELGLKLLKGDSTKCVGGDGAICLYEDIWSGMIMWRQVEDKSKWEWSWIEGCCSISGKQLHNISIRGLFIHPNLASSHIFAAKSHTLSLNE